jgi:hypothetical protein
MKTKDSQLCPRDFKHGHQFPLPSSLFCRLARENQNERSATLRRHFLENP